MSANRAQARGPYRAPPSPDNSDGFTQVNADDDDNNFDDGQEDDLEGGHSYNPRGHVGNADEDEGDDDRYSPPAPPHVMAGGSPLATRGVNKSSKTRRGSDESQPNSHPLWASQPASQRPSAGHRQTPGLTSPFSHGNHSLGGTPPRVGMHSHLNAPSYDEHGMGISNRPNMTQSHPSMQQPDTRPLSSSRIQTPRGRRIGEDMMTQSLHDLPRGPTASHHDARSEAGHPEVVYQQRNTGHAVGREDIRRSGRSRSRPPIADEFLDQRRRSPSPDDDDAEFDAVHNAFGRMDVSGRSMASGHAHQPPLVFIPPTNNYRQYATIPRSHTYAMGPGAPGYHTLASPYHMPEGQYRRAEDYAYMRPQYAQQHSPQITFSAPGRPLVMQVGNGGVHFAAGFPSHQTYYGGRPTRAVYDVPRYWL